MRIFVSYSRTDEDFVRKLAKDLSSTERQIWLDVKDIHAGMKWSSAIQESLRTCDVMLVVISPDSMASTNVEDEWQYFLDKKKPLIPILWRDADVHYQLSRLQHINFIEKSYQDAVKELSRVLSEPIQPPSQREGTGRLLTSSEPGPVDFEGTLRSNIILQSRYRIIGLLVVGGGGRAVYQARDLNFPAAYRRVVVKEIVHSIGDIIQSEIALRQFNRQANILATLTHRGIPSIIDCFSINDRSYLVMEYVEGTDLDILTNGNNEHFPIADVIRWTRDLCEILAYLHNRRPEPIILRDIRPSNIVIDTQGHAWFVDFGIAKMLQGSFQGTMIGTEGYSAPENYKGYSDPVSDIFGLGATLHHILTLQDPRLEPPFSFAERPIRTYNPAVTPEFEALVMKALALNPEDRFPSVNVMLHALDDIFLSGEKASISSAPEINTSQPKANISPNPSPIPRWAFQTGGEIRSTPVVSEDTVFITSYDRGLYALDAGSGQLKWRFLAEDTIVSSPDFEPNKNLVFFGSKDSCLYAVTADTGQICWKSKTQGPVYSSPTASLDYVFFGSNDGTFYAAIVSTGRLMWTFEAQAPIRTKPAVSDAHVFFGTKYGELYCLNISGTERWRFKARREILSTPLLFEDQVIFGSLDGRVYAVDIESGFSNWSFDTKKPVASSPCISNDLLYIGSANGYLYALDPFTARTRWQFDAQSPIVSSPVVDAGTVYCGTQEGRLYGVDTHTGKAQWVFQTDGAIFSSPLVNRGIVYIGSADNKLYAIPLH